MWLDAENLRLKLLSLNWKTQSPVPACCLQPVYADDEESEKCHLGAIIVRDLSIVVSNYRSVMSLDEYCKKHKVLGIANVDTRALTKVSATAMPAAAGTMGGTAAAAVLQSTSVHVAAVSHQRCNQAGSASSQQWCLVASSVKSCCPPACAHLYTGLQPSLCTPVLL